MGIVHFRNCAVAAILAATILINGPAVAADTPPAPVTCDDAINGGSAPTVSKAYNAEFDATPNMAGANTVQLGDTITIEGVNLKKLFEKPCDKKVVVLFIDNMPMIGIAPYPPSDPKSERVHFMLQRSEDARAAWTAILGSPLSKSGNVQVSMGFKDGFALAGTDMKVPMVHFTLVPTFRLLGWAVIFAIMAIGFYMSARKSSIIRDPSPVAAGAKGTYSLSRIQGVLWFFVIIAAYLFIGIVTKDFSNSINSTALILLGIGAGTVVGSAAIDAQKDTEKQRADTIAAIAKVKAEIDACDIAIAKLGNEIKGPPQLSESDVMTRRSDQTAQVAKKADLKSQLRKLEGRSEGFLIDILSDANGISFHRFQIAAWTVVLGIIFIVEVYQNLAMPTFNTTLMGILGLSAGTYLGLKIPEPTTPSKPPLGTTG